MKHHADTIAELRDLLAEWVAFFRTDYDGTIKLIGPSGFDGVQVEPVYCDEHGLIVGTWAEHYTPNRSHRPAIALRAGKRIEHVRRELKQRSEEAMRGILECLDSKTDH